MCSTADLLASVLRKAWLGDPIQRQYIQSYSLRSSHIAGTSSDIKVVSKKHAPSPVWLSSFTKTGLSQSVK